MTSLATPFKKLAPFLGRFAIKRASLAHRPGNDECRLKFIDHIGVRAAVVFQPIDPLIEVNLRTKDALGPRLQRTCVELHPTSIRDGAKTMTALQGWIVIGLLVLILLGIIGLGAEIEYLPYVWRTYSP